MSLELYICVYLNLHIYTYICVCVGAGAACVHSVFLFLMLLHYGRTLCSCVCILLSALFCQLGKANCTCYWPSHELVDWCDWEIVIHPLTYPLWLTCANETDLSGCDLLHRSRGLVMDIWEAKNDSGNLILTMSLYSTGLLTLYSSVLSLGSSLNLSYPSQSLILSPCFLTLSPSSNLSRRRASLRNRSLKQLCQVCSKEPPNICFRSEKSSDVTRFQTLFLWLMSCTERQSDHHRLSFIKVNLIIAMRAGYKSKDFYSCLSLTVLFHFIFINGLFKDMELYFLSEYSRRLQKGLWLLWHHTLYILSTNSFMILKVNIKQVNHGWLNYQPLIILLVINYKL